MLTVLRIRDGGAVDLTIDGTGLDEHLFTVFDDGQVHYYHRDRRNSVYLVTDAQGQALERYHYTAYGESVVFAPDGTVLDDTAIDNRFGFQGHVFDAGLGLVEMRARFYRPAWGRFLAPDPIGLAGGPNLYAFVEGKTLTLWDPFGFDGECGWFCRAGSSIGLAVGSAGAAIGSAARTAGGIFVRQVVPRLGGALQATIGGVGALAGAGLCTSGLGCLIGGPLALVSTDFAAAGATTVMTGEYTPTLIKRAGTAIGGERFGRDVEEAQMFIATAGAASYMPRHSSSTRTNSTPRTNPQASPKAAQTRPPRHAQPAQQQQARHRSGSDEAAGGGYYIQNGVRRCVACRDAGGTDVPATIFRPGQAPETRSIPLDQLHSPKASIPNDARYNRIVPPVHTPIEVEPRGLPGQLPTRPIKDVKLE